MEVFGPRCCLSGAVPLIAANTVSVSGRSSPKGATALCYGFTKDLKDSLNSLQVDRTAPQLPSPLDNRSFKEVS